MNEICVEKHHKIWTDEQTSESPISSINTFSCRMFTNDSVISLKLVCFCARQSLRGHIVPIYHTWCAKNLILVQVHYVLKACGQNATIILMCVRSRPNVIYPYFKLIKSPSLASTISLIPKMPEQKMETCLPDTYRIAGNPISCYRVKSNNMGAKAGLTH
jgi:hypothetical protein